MTLQKKISIALSNTSLFYPVVDDEFERLDSCRTGIRDGRLNLISQKEYLF